jgi:hypothetical protein
VLRSRGDGASTASAALCRAQLLLTRFTPTCLGSSAAVHCSVRAESTCLSLWPACLLSPPCCYASICPALTFGPPGRWSHAPCKIMLDGVLALCCVIKDSSIICNNRNVRLNYSLQILRAPTQPSGRSCEALEFRRAHCMACAGGHCLTTDSTASSLIETSFYVKARGATAFSAARRVLSRRRLARRSFHLSGSRSQ